MLSAIIIDDMGQRARPHSRLRATTSSATRRASLRPPVAASGIPR